MTRQARRGRPPPGRDRAGGAQPGRRAVGGGRRRGRAAGARVTGVRSGLDVLGSRLSSLLAGRRVGLLCHPASVTRDLTHAADVIRALRRVRLTALFAPEHGLTGVAQDHAHIGAECDRADRAPRRTASTASASSRRPPCCADSTSLVVDLQDVGARYYTFVWTIVLAMRVCAREGKPVIVLDRPNPLGGERLEGNMAGSELRLVRRALPAADPPRHDHRRAGRLSQRDAGARLRPHGGADGGLAARRCSGRTPGCRGWRRRRTCRPPTPRASTRAAACVEGTNLSEGRGTTRPFEWVGAPYLDGARAGAALERRGLPGVRFRAIAFEPDLPQVGAARLRRRAGARDRPGPLPVLRDLPGPDRRGAPAGPARASAGSGRPTSSSGSKLPIDLLCGADRIRRAIEAGTPLPRMEASWRGDLAALRARAPALPALPMIGLDECAPPALPPGLPGLGGPAHHRAGAAVHQRLAAARRRAPSASP